MNARLAAVLLATALSACAAVAPCPPAAPSTARATGAADSAYAAGRAYHAAGEHALAVKAYRLALRHDPGHVEARNAMAVAYAERGHRALAAAMLRDLAAAVPQDRRYAYVFNNLGYASLLAGLCGQAGSALRRATELDPGDLHAAANLRQLPACGADS